MGDNYEAAIVEFLTIDGKVFIAPQFLIAFDDQMRDGGSCPDFVALDLRRQQVVVVEVTSGWELETLNQRVRERQQRWYNPIRRKLLEHSIINECWRFRFLGFVRKERVTHAKAAFGLDSDVTFFAIEDATFRWAYWEDRINKGLPK